MYILIIIIVLVVLFIIDLVKTTNSDKPTIKPVSTSKHVHSHNNISNFVQSYRIEADRRLQILNESLSIIDKTKSLETLNGRYIDVCEQIRWMYENGVELSHKSKDEAQKMVDDNKNENIVRIAHHTYSVYQDKVNSLKTKKGKDNAISKMEQKISECLSSIVQSDNSDMSKKEILDIYQPSTPTVVCSTINIDTKKIKSDEINREYRTAEQERNKQFDFVVGYEIKLSNKKLHCDICERLTGKYPKTFKWSGWYDGCTCYQIPILKTEEEFWAWDEEKGNNMGSVNEVKDVPDNFKQWVKENRDFIEKYDKGGTLPDFIKYNMDVVQRILSE